MRFFGWFRRPPVEAVKPSRSGYTYTFVGHDEQLAVRTKHRRDEAERMRQHARQIDTGEPEKVSPFKRRA